MQSVRNAHADFPCWTAEREWTCRQQKVRVTSFIGTWLECFAYRAPFLQVLSCHSLGHPLGAYPAPSGSRRSASQQAAPFGFGFPTENFPHRVRAASAQQRGQSFLSEPPQKDTPSALGSG